MVFEVVNSANSVRCWNGHGGFVNLNARAMLTTQDFLDVNVGVGLME
jgi:hypothetical protein